MFGRRNLLAISGSGSGSINHDTASAPTTTTKSTLLLPDRALHAPPPPPPMNSSTTFMSPSKNAKKKSRTEQLFEAVVSGATRGRGLNLLDVGCAGSGGLLNVHDDVGEIDKYDDDNNDGDENDDDDIRVERKERKRKNSMNDKKKKKRRDKNGPVSAVTAATAPVGGDEDGYHDDEEGMGFEVEIDAEDGLEIGGGDDDARNASMYSVTALQYHSAPISTPPSSPSSSSSSSPTSKNNACDDDEYDDDDYDEYDEYDDVESEESERPDPPKSIVFLQASSTASTAPCCSSSSASFSPPSPIKGKEEGKRIKAMPTEKISSIIPSQISSMTMMTHMMAYAATTTTTKTTTTTTTSTKTPRQIGWTKSSSSSTSSPSPSSHYFRDRYLSATVTKTTSDASGIIGRERVMGGGIEETAAVDKRAIGKEREMRDEMKVEGRGTKVGVGMEGNYNFIQPSFSSLSGSTDSYTSAPSSGSGSGADGVGGGTRSFSAHLGFLLQSKGGLAEAMITNPTKSIFDAPHGGRKCSGDGNDGGGGSDCNSSSSSSSSSNQKRKNKRKDDDNEGHGKAKVEKAEIKKHHDEKRANLSSVHVRFDSEKDDGNVECRDVVPSGDDVPNHLRSFLRARYDEAKAKFEAESRERERRHAREMECVRVELTERHRQEKEALERQLECVRETIAGAADKFEWLEGAFSASVGTMSLSLSKSEPRQSLTLSLSQSQSQPPPPPSLPSSLVLTSSSSMSSESAAGGEAAREGGKSAHGSKTEGGVGYVSSSGSGGDDSRQHLFRLRNELELSESSLAKDTTCNDVEDIGSDDDVDGKNEMDESDDDAPLRMLSSAAAVVEFDVKSCSVEKGERENRRVVDGNTSNDGNENEHGIVLLLRKEVAGLRSLLAKERVELLSAAQGGDVLRKKLEGMKSLLAKERREKEQALLKVAASSSSFPAPPPSTTKTKRPAAATAAIEFHDEFESEGGADVNAVIVARLKKELEEMAAMLAKEREDKERAQPQASTMKSPAAIHMAPKAKERKEPVEDGGDGSCSYVPTTKKEIMVDDDNFSLATDRDVTPFAMDVEAASVVDSENFVALRNELEEMKSMFAKEREEKEMLRSMGAAELESALSDRDAARAELEKMMMAMMASSMAAAAPSAPAASTTATEAADAEAPCLDDRSEYDPYRVGGGDDDVDEFNDYDDDDALLSSRDKTVSRLGAAVAAGTEQGTQETDEEWLLFEAMAAASCDLAEQETCTGKASREANAAAAAAAAATAAELERVRAENDALRGEMVELKALFARESDCLEGTLPGAERSLVEEKERLSSINNAAMKAVQEENVALRNELDAARQLHEQEKVEITDTFLTKEKSYVEEIQHLKRSQDSEHDEYLNEALAEAKQRHEREMERYEEELMVAEQSFTDRMEELKREHMMELQTAWDDNDLLLRELSELRTLNAELDGVHKAVEQASKAEITDRDKAHVAELVSVEAELVQARAQCEEYSDKLESAANDHDAAIEVLKKAHADELVSIQNELDDVRALHHEEQERLASIKMTLASEIEFLKDSHVADLTSARSELSEAKAQWEAEIMKLGESEKALISEIQRIKEIHITEINAVQTEVKEAQALCEEAVQKKADAEQRHIEETKKLEQAHAVALESIQAELNQTKALYASKMRDQASAESLEAAYADELSSLRTELSETKALYAEEKKRLVSITEKFSKEAENLKQAYSSELTNMQTNLEETRTLCEKREEQLAEIKQAYILEAESLKEAHLKDMKALRSELDATKALYIESKEKLTAVELEFAAQTERVEVAHAAEKDSMMTSLNKANALCAERKNEIEAVQEAFLVDLEVIKNAHSAEVSVLKTEISEARALHEQEQKKRADTEEAHADETACRKQAHVNELSVLQSDLNQTKALLTEAKDKLSSAEWSLSTQRENLEKAHADEVEAVKVELRRKLALTMEGRDSSEAERLEAAKQAFLADMEALKEAHSAEISALNTGLSEARALRDEEQKKLADNEKAHADEKACLKQTHINELSALQTELLETKALLTEAKHKLLLAEQSVLTQRDNLENVHAAELEAVKVKLTHKLTLAMEEANEKAGQKMAEIQELFTVKSQQLVIHKKQLEDAAAQERASDEDMNYLLTKISTLEGNIAKESVQREKAMLECERLSAAIQEERSVHAHKVEDLVKTIERLEDDMTRQAADAKATRVKSSKQMIDLMAREDELEAEGAELATKVAGLEATVVQLVSEKEEAIALLERTAEQRDLALENIRALEKEFSLVSEKAECFQQREANLRAQTESERRELNTKISNLENAVIELLADKEKALADLDAVAKKNELAEEVVNQLRHRTVQLEEKVCLFSGQLDESGKRVISLQAQLERESRRFEETVAKHVIAKDKALEELSAVASRNDLSQQSLAQSNEKVLQLETELASLSAGMDAAKQQARDLESQLVSALSEKDMALATVGELCDLVDKKEAQAISLTSEKNRAEKLSQDLTKRFEEIKVQIVELKKESKSSESQIESLKNDYSIAQARVTELLAEINELKSRNFNLEVEVAELEMLVGQAVADKENAQKDLFEMTERHEAVHESVKQSQETIEHITSELRLKKVALMDAETQKQNALQRALYAEQKLEDLTKAMHETRNLVKVNERLHRALHVETDRRRFLHNELEDQKGKIRVYARIRPLTPAEKKQNCEIALNQVEDRVCMLSSSNPPRQKSWIFDRIFNGTASEGNTQEAVFEDTRLLITSAIDGFNVCVFAYGQTGSGKTYTMFGSGGRVAGTSLDASALDNNSGLAPRTAAAIFQILEEKEASSHVEVSVAMFELYNDTFRDLLHQGEGDQEHALKIKLGEHSESGLVEVEGALKENVRNASELLAVLQRGVDFRTTSSTAMNADSSRSHLITSIVTTVKDKFSGETARGKITLVDLAGSERLSKTGISGHPMKEAQSINKSLSALGDVIGSLTSKNRYVPYRNHPLTMLMSDSLGGNAKTLMFVCCSPADYNHNETNNSLDFAQRCKDVKNEAIVAPTQKIGLPTLSKKDGGGTPKRRNSTVRRSGIQSPLL